MAGILFCDCHALAVRRMTANRRIYGAGILLEVPVDHRLIHACKTVFFDLLCQTLMGKIVFGNDQQAAGVLIDPMDNPRPDHAVDPRKGIAAVRQQRVDQRSTRMSGCRMHHHSLGLIDHQQVRILITDIQWDRLRQNIQPNRFRQDHFDCIPCAQAVFFIQSFPSTGNLALLGQALRGRTSEFFHADREKLIQAHSLVLRPCYDVQCLPQEHFRISHAFPTVSHLSCLKRTGYAPSRGQYRL